MKRLLAILLLLPFILSAQTTPLSFANIPFANPDLQRPGAGANEWSYDQNIVNIPVQGTNTQRLDRYWRFNWRDFQTTGSSSTYSFATLDQKIQQSIDKGQEFSFGIMQMCSGCDVAPNINVIVSGAKMMYPDFLHTLMQAEATKDYISGGTWTPNYNSPNYLSALKNLNIAINNHLLTTSYKGVRFQDIIGQIDIRGYGDFGEWTNNTFTAGTLSVASGDSIISYHVHVFDKFQCVYMIATLDGNQLSNTQVAPAIGYYALMASNSVGKLGWRRDNWGQVDGYIHNWLELNNTSFGGITFKDSIMKRFLYAPVVGEPQDCGSETNFSNLAAQGTQYGGCSFGNGNFNCIVNATIQNNFRLASKTFGYRLNLNVGGTGSVTGSQAGGPFQIVQRWRNVGASPSYQNWNCVYDLRTGPTATPIWSGTSSFNPRLFSPAGSDNVVTDNFTLTSVPAGTYELHMTMKDPLGYRFPMPIYITNTQQADGSYIILSNIVITANGPVANAGPNQSIIIATVSLTGAASINANTYLWKNISGPNTPSITTPTTVGTTVTGLITGTYVFELDINGATSGVQTDQVQVIVNAPPVQANAGSNQTITLPTSTVSLSGSLSTGATTYVWTRTSGPNSPTITTPTTVNTTVTGLIAGTYVFNLSINSGASNSNVTVNVLPAPLPIANAGISQTIALPTASVSVSGSGSSGNITGYAWSELSGPNAAVFGTATTVSSTVTGLIEGIYLIQLALNGGAAIDTMRVYVNPAAPPVPSGQTIFTTQTPVGGLTAPTQNDGNQAGLTGIELGNKFRASVNGFVLGIRYYKTNQINGGTKIGELYSYPGGVRLGSATFVNESVTGWQTAVFATPIAITAGTTYIAAYFSPNGNYVSSTNYMTTAVVNGFLTSLADGTDGPNGVYKYSNSAVFPISNFQKSNYWVDPLFSSPNTNPCNCHPRNKFTTQRTINGF